MKKVLVFVHGAGKQPPDYAVEPLGEIALLLGAEPPCVAVYYADITNIGVAQVAPDPPEVAQFKLAFSMEVQKDVAANQVVSPSVSAQAISPQFLAELIATEVNEIAGYLFNPDIYARIQARMCNDLAEAAQQGDALVIASHSLGTVVAFDALRAVGNQYNVSSFFTLGSPVSKLRRLGLRTGDLASITAEHVVEWQNWYDTTDPVSNPLGPSFPAPGYRLRDVFVDNALLPPASHDYFRNREVLSAIAAALR